MYQLGVGGLTPSIEKARELFELAAEQGNEEAMFQLSCTYMPDDDVEEIFDEFTNGSDDDDGLPDTPLSAAMSEVARREIKASGDESHSQKVDILLSSEEEADMQRKALYWVCRAAKKGHAGAQFNLGVMHLLDDYPGVERSEAVARRLFQKSAKQGNPSSPIQLGLHVYGRSWRIKNVFKERTKAL